jgi:hypothetical protein
MYSNLWKSILFAALLGAILPSISVQSALGQSQSINGTIRGTVMDATGAVLPDVTITITNVETGFTRQVKSGGDGIYIVPNLPIGAYSVLAEANGFAPLTQKGVNVGAGSSVTVDEQLHAGSVATQVMVVGDAPILEVSRLDLSRTISEEETQNLPLSSRNPYNFILFQPGVSGHPNPENGIPRTVDTNGLVDRVNYQLDGMVDTESDRYGLRLFAISDSYVREIETISNSYSPEFGNTAGIIFNTITGSGTNTYHGTAGYIWRPEAASSCPILATCNPAVAGGVVKPSLHVDDVIGNVGGPVIKDKLFYYAAYEHLRRSYPQPNTIGAAMENFLETLGVDQASDFKTAPTVQHAQWFDTRMDAAINKKNQLFIRYNYFRNVYPFNSDDGGSYAISAAADFQDRAHIIGAQLVTTFSPDLFNEFRGSWPYRNEHHVADALTGAGPMVHISAATVGGVAYNAVYFGGSNSVGDKFQEKIPSFNDNITWIKGKHSMKYGFGFQQNLDTQLADIYTQYNFANITQYENAESGKSPQVYSSLAASIGNPGAAYHSVFFDFFGQDSWQLRKNLLVTYGVRYDQYRAPTPPAGEPFAYTQNFRTPEGDFSPRLGVSYQPFTKTVVRLNAGIFYEATPTNTWYNPLYNNGAAGTGSFITTIAGSSTPGTCQPAFPNSPQNVPAGCISTQSIYALTPRFKNEYVWNANLQVAQQIAKNDSLTVGYILTNGRNMQFLRNMNLINPTSYLADGRPVYSTSVSAATRAYPQFNNITLIDIGSNSSYNALTATYEHRLSAGLTTSASYTWAHSITNTPEGNSYEFSTPVEDTSDPLRDRGNSGINRPNALTISLVYEPNTQFENRILNGAIRNNTFALLGNMSSGDEQSITTSTDLNNDAIATSRPLYVGRDSVRTPAIYQYDLRYTRTLATLFDKVQPKLQIEGNNILNRSNVTSINTSATVVTPATYVSGGLPIGTITTQPTFRPTSTLLEARILQFGLKFDF